ncbi:hypothetical protein B9Z55_027942 [Caenorhabditis nigoni]|uniref:Protein kinase domain-containing protein n=1 Tax=Caenorhabditis nigoni TaxID=1611254 RepID=A0A2G5SDF8_9PELO|nr:hypothetical protein B9Z55_027942 [Caenorhabditis nigoni]
MSISKNDILNNSYQVTEMVNMGYFCVIFSARDLKTNTTVAVKNLKCEGEADLKAEFEYLTLLSSFKYCPTPLAFGEDPEVTSFFVLSMERESLYELKFKNDNNKFSPKTTSLILFHAQVALKAIHQAGIVHGDVTMMNIALPKSLGKGRIIFSDYGCSVPINPISSRSDISNLLMVTGIASKENKTLTECRDAFENHPCTTVENLLEMVADETMFGPNAPFDWELEKLE